MGSSWCHYVCEITIKASPYQTIGGNKGRSTMVKRYTPDAKIQTYQYDNESDEAVAKMIKDPEGDYVSYEAYRLLEKKYEKLFYGEECYRVAKKTGLSCQQVQDMVSDFCNDHMEHFGYFPAEMDFGDIDGVVINTNSMMKILPF